MGTIIEILSPGFLLRDALISSVILGLVCPLVGVYFVIRKMIFLGVALPQVSAAGIAFAFWGYGLIFGSHHHGQIGEWSLAVLGSLFFTTLVLAGLACLEQRSRVMIDGRIGTVYALAGAVTILFLSADPYAEAQMVSLLKGDILATTGGSLRLTLLVYSAVAALVLLCRKQFLLVAFDRDLASVMQMRVVFWDALLFFIVGVTLSFGVMVAGPLVVFGFVVIPALTSRLIVRSMSAFSICASLLGGAVAFFGFALAYRFDLPLGPTQVALSVVLLIIVSTARWAYGIGQSKLKSAMVTVGILSCLAGCGISGTRGTIQSAADSKSIVANGLSDLNPGDSVALIRHDCSAPKPRPSPRRHAVHYCKSTEIAKGRVIEITPNGEVRLEFPEGTEVKERDVVERIPAGSEEG